MDELPRNYFMKNLMPWIQMNLINTLSDLGIKYALDILINWYEFERVDALRTDTLDRYFDDIWFPTSDDINLFDESLDWIVSIRHDGCITYLK